MNKPHLSLQNRKINNLQHQNINENLSKSRRSNNPRTSSFSQRQQYKKHADNYKQLLRILAQENDKKKQQQLEKIKNTSFSPQSSRWKTLKEQNQHIQRVLTPIRNSFLEQRRKKLSQKRKSQSKNHRENGSIIQTSSNQSLTHKSKRKKHIKNNLSELSRQSQNHDEKYKNKRQISQINFQPQQNNNRSSRKKLQNKKNNAKINQTNFQQSQYIKQQGNLEQKIQNSAKQKRKNQKNDNKKNKQSNQNFDMQNIKGVKIPEKAIQKASSLLNRSKFNKKDQPARKPPTLKDKNIKQSTLNQKKSSKLDKRLPKQKQRKTKDWKNSQKQQKQKKQKQERQAKDKQFKNKQWKWAQKEGKKVKFQKIIKIDSNGNQTQEWIQVTERNQKEDSQIAQQQQQKKQITEKQELQNEEQEPQQKFQKSKKNQKLNQWVEDQKPQIKQIKNQDKQQKENVNKIKNNKIQQKKDSKINQKIVNQIKNEKVQQNNNQQVKQKIDNSTKNDQISLKKDQKTEQQKILNNKQQQQITQSVEKQNKKINKQEIKPIQNIQKKQLISDNKNIQNNEVQKNVIIKKDSPKKSQIKKQVQKQKPIQKNQKLQDKIIKLNQQNKAKNIQKQQDQILKSPSIQKIMQKTDNKRDSKINKQNNQKFNIKEKPKANQQQKKTNTIEKVLNNQNMQQQGIMQITQSKFHIYNHQSQVSHEELNSRIIEENLSNRAQIIQFLYNLPAQYEKQINKFIPNQNSLRCFSKIKLKQSKNQDIKKSIKSPKLKQAIQQLIIFEKMNIDLVSLKKKKGNKDVNNQKTNFLQKIFQPFQNKQGKRGIWLYCVGVWRLITVDNKEISHNTFDLIYLYKFLQKAYLKVLQNYYYKISQDQLLIEQVLRMLTGLKVSKLMKTKNNSQRIFKQIQYNIKKAHLIRAFNKNNCNDSKFTSQTINCVRKIQSTPEGQKVIQIVSYNLNSIQNKPKYYWIKQQKFLTLFESFMVISKRNKSSYWTNTHLQIKNKQKANIQTSGSITIYPLKDNKIQNKQKCTIAFYKQIQPYVLKLVGKASEKLPQNLQLFHTSKLYFEFNIKGNYYVFLEIQDGQYNIAVESNSQKTQLQFVQYVLKDTNKNQQCQYVEIDKIFKKKNNPEALQKANEFKQLMNFMKKNNPQIEEIK